MNSHGNQCQEVSPESTETVAVLAIRSGLYAVLAKGFAHPDEATLEFFRQCGQMEIEPREDLSRQVGELLESAQSVAVEELAAGYLRLFHPLNGPFPYQSEHGKSHDFSKVHNLADIMGFYRAFGVEPRDDRPDHIAAELEFMHLLTLKEKHALETGQTDKATLCREASEKFLRLHLLTWTDTLLDAMRARNDNTLPFYVHLMAVLELFMESESEKEALS